MSSYNVEVTTEDFFKIYKKAFTEGDKLMLSLLLNTVKNNPQLNQEMWEVTIPANSNSSASNYIDESLRVNRYEWVETFFSHSLSCKYIEKALKKGLADLQTNNKTVKYFSQIETLMRNHSLKDSEIDNEDSSFKPEIKNVLIKFVNNLLQIEENKPHLIKSFLNAEIKRLSNKKSVPWVNKPAFFEYLHLFESCPEKVEDLHIINWKATDALGQNILFNILDYHPKLINIIIANMDNSDWECKNENDKTPARRLAETDFTKYQNVKRLNYMLSNDQITFENNDFRIMLKRVVKSYKLKTNSDLLNEEIKNTFTLLNNHSLINSPEGQNALEFFNNSEDSKFGELKLALLNHKLQTTLVDKPAKSKLKI